MWSGEKGCHYVQNGNVGVLISTRLLAGRSQPRQRNNMAATTEFVAVQARLIGTELPDEPIPKLAFNRSQFFSELIMRPSEVAGIIVRTARAMISPAYVRATKI